MKIAVVYSLSNQNVFSLCGLPHRLKYGKQAAQRIIEDSKINFLSLRR